MVGVSDGDVALLSPDNRSEEENLTLMDQGISL